MKLSIALLAAALVLTGKVLAEDGFVPFVIPTDPNPKSLIRFTSPPIPPDGKRVAVKDGHFVVDGKRFRVWGVNDCFGANFPTHADADRVAQRMADFGVNSVRFHHMDMQNFPSGIWDPKDPMKLSDEALDRLDYFVDALAKRGIYANINLHVSRGHAKALKLPDADKLVEQDKMVDIFTPALIEANRKYAKDLLTHVNAYRKVRYADDPAVSFVEINNEDSLFMWSNGVLPNLPPYFADILRAQFNAYLKERYGSDDKLRAAWDKDASTLGENMLLGLDKSAPAAQKGWNLEQHEKCVAKLAPLKSDAAAGRVECTTVDDTNWHIQLIHCGLAVKDGEYYTLSFRARSDKDRAIGYGVGMATDPWANLGLSGQAKLTPEWKTFQFGFMATAYCDNARVSLALGGDASAVELADVQLRPGGRVGLGKDESAEKGTVAVFGAAETPVRALDRVRFFIVTEKAYYDGMREYLKKDLGLKTLVTGTIIFGPQGFYSQGDMDYIDAHAYWQHPQFPGKSWDANNWLVQQEAMVDHPDRSTLVGLSAQRLAGKPFTVSEYNHSAPNDYQAECVPMAASWAAAQDWDGIWFFAYSHRTNDWDRKTYSGFFDIDANPAKWGFMPAGAAMFREGGIAPLAMAMNLDVAAAADPLARIADATRRFGMNGFAYEEAVNKLTVPALLLARVYATFGSYGPEPTSQATKPNPMMWVGGDAKTQSIYSATFPGASVLIWRGPANPTTKPTSPAFAAMTMTPLDARPLDKSGKILITACGRCENTGMKFSADRRTVGTEWGKEPVMIQAMENTFTLPKSPTGAWKCQVLAPDGTPSAEVKVEVDKDGDAKLTLSPQYKTMWYLLTAEALK
jgi:hypothetical protein